MKKKYSENEISKIVEDLTVSFENACETYRNALEARESNRSKKELDRGNSRGTNIHKFQSSFAWILHDIQRGPKCFIENHMDDAYELISHINKISDS